MSKWNAPLVVAVAWSSILVWPQIVVAQHALRVGAEFQVNTHTVNYQRFPAIAAGTGGDFVVVWHSYGQDGSNTGIFARRFDVGGVPQAVEFQIDNYTTGATQYPAIAVDGNGDFVVAWDSSGQDGGYRGIFARRFDSNGTPKASEFPVNLFTPNNQRAAAVATDSDGNFLIVWGSHGNDGGGYGIAARRYDAAGVGQASEFQVNVHITNNQQRPVVASDDDGDFIVAWESFAQDGSVYGVFARLFDSAGIAQATELQVNSHTDNSQRYPSVATHGDGDFIVAWQSDAQDGSALGVFARLFDSAGAAQASEFQVNSHSAYNQRLPDGATDLDGGFVVVWNSSYQDGDNGGLFGRRFDSTGAPLATEFQVNAHTLLNQQRVAVAANGDGDWVAAWQSLSARAHPRHRRRHVVVTAHRRTARPPLPVRVHRRQPHRGRGHRRVRPLRRGRDPALPPEPRLLR